jgi:hypothetical protein
MDPRVTLVRLFQASKLRWRAIAPFVGPFTALATSAFMVAFLAVASSRNVVHAQQNPQGLVAERLNNEDIDLRWNARDPQLDAADEAILTVVDGGNERSEYLNAEQIQLGSYRYHRQSWDVSFCLRIFHNGRKLFVDDLRLFDSPPADPGDVAAFAVAPGHLYLQVATKPKRDAEQLGRALAAQKWAVAYDPMKSANGWYRVLVGPVQQDSELPGTIAEIRHTGLVEAEPLLRKF